MSNINPRLARSIAEYVGKDYPMSDGELLTVISMRSYADVTVQVKGTEYTFNTTMGAVKRGTIKNPFADGSPIAFDTYADRYNGCIYPTNEGYHVKVIDYKGHDKVFYQILDDNAYVGCTTMQNIQNGEIHNPYKVNSFGGYLGGDNRYRGNDFEWLRNKWNLMIIRAKEENKDYYHTYHPNTTAYDNVMVDPYWLNYSNFAKWYMDTYNSLNHEMFKDFDVDKDLLYPYYRHSTNDKKCYGPATSVLIPHDLNNMLSSAIVKERYDKNKDYTPIPKGHPIKMAANYYFNHNGIDKATYEAIMAL